MNPIWHLGLAVPDLQAGMRELSDVFDVTWRPVYERNVHLTDENGRTHDVLCRVTFSLTARKDRPCTISATGSTTRTLNPNA
jgi:hypothetical protein